MIILPFRDSNRAFVTVVMTTQITFKGGGGGHKNEKLREIRRISWQSMMELRFIGK